MKKTQTLEVDLDQNNEKIDKITREINRIQEAIRKRRQEHQHHREHSLRADELKNLKTEIGIKIDALKQIVSHIEEVKEQVKLRNKKFKKEN